MGVSLGSRPDFIHELANMGFRSLIFTVLAIAGSILLVYPLSVKFLSGMKLKEGDEE
jgi:hypothetical protein